MLPLVVALAAFVIVHAAMSRPWLRDPLTRRLGRSGYGAVNGTVSLIGLILVFWAYRAAPYIELWPPLEALRTVPIAVMPVAAILFVAGVTTPCAGLRGDRLPDGARAAPGILGVTRHPIPWAIMIWAGSHIAANGDAAALVFFGTFFAFAALAPTLVDRRRRRLCGEEVWSRFAGATSNLPFAAALAGRTALDWPGVGLTRIAMGAAVYVLLLATHQWFAGVPLLTL